MRRHLRQMASVWFSDTVIHSPRWSRKLSLLRWVIISSPLLEQRAHQWLFSQRSIRLVKGGAVIHAFTPSKSKMTFWSLSLCCQVTYKSSWKLFSASLSLFFLQTLKCMILLWVVEKNVKKSKMCWTPPRVMSWVKIMRQQGRTFLLCL